MATFNEIVYDVREALKQYSDDSEISDRYIRYLYNIKRAKYLRQEMNRYARRISNTSLQTFCIKLEEVSASECSVSFECDTILRSTKPIPTPITLHTKPALTKVKPTKVLSRPFNFVTKDRIPYIEGNPFSKGIYAFLDPTDYIYVYSKENISILECLTITGVFEDPLELRNYPNCCDCTAADSPCYDLAVTDYPLDSHMIDIIRGEIVNELANLEQVKEDKENDAEDS